MTTAAIILVVLSMPMLWVVLRRPVQRRLALRYPFRRPVESLLVILGTLLGTSIITGSLIVGDTIDRSIRASAYDQLGPIDELVTVSGLDEGAAVATRFDGFDDPVIDGVLSFVTAPASVVASATQPRAQLIEVDPVEAAAFGSDPAIVGLDGSAPASGHAMITTDLADRAGATVGDTIAVFAYGQRVDLVVDRIVERRGVAGFWPIDTRQQSYNVIVAPGAIADLAAGAPSIPGLTAEPPSVHIALSNVGGVEAGADLTDDALAAIEPVLAGAGATAQGVKRDVLDTAAELASGLTQLYFTMGMFAVAAGILLVINIFVMLADDRRSELGMLRAIGLRRRPLVGAFTTEGWLYSISAGMIGALLGIGIGWVIAWRADQILTSGDDLSSLALTFSFDWSTIAIGFAIGFAISMATIAATSARTSRMNIIAAIRDLPVDATRDLRRRWLAAGLALIGLGALWTTFAAGSEDGYGVALGPMLALVGLVPLMSERIGFRPAATIVSIAILVWGTTFVFVFDSLGIELEIPIFLVQGLSMAAAAISLVTLFQGAIGRWLARRLHGSVTARLGLAYPIARRSRTAMTLGMFAIVILTLVYLSVLAFMFRNQVDEITDDLSGGFGVVVSTNPTNPLTAEQLAALDDVGAVAPLTFGYAEFEVDGTDPQPWPLTGFGAELAADPPALQDRGEYANDAEAWRAVAADPNLIIIDEFFLASGGGPPTGTPEIGSSFAILDPTTGNRREVTVAAWAEDDFLTNGVFYGRSGVDELTGGRAIASRFFVEPLDDDAALATEIRTTFVQNGADANAVRTTVETVLSQQNGFFTLMQQFVGVGLVVGICGIGVVMIRAVRERRRVVGVLRSLGFQPRAVGRAFLIEAGFVAVEGVVIGVTVALIGTYGLVASGVSFTEGMTWGVPWRDIGLIVVLALGASAITAIFPARRASKILPAEALRITD